MSNPDRLFWDVIYRIEKAVDVLSKEQVKELELCIAEWFASHWRDDDNPKAEYRASREVREVVRCFHY